MARTDSLAKLAFAYGVHLTRRRLTRPRSQFASLLETYAPDGIRPLLPEERERHPQLIGCINCGLCALAAGRIGSVRPHPRRRPAPPARRLRRQVLGLMWLRVIHILYTVCGNNTTSSANGQYPIATPSTLASYRGRARPPRGAVHDVALGRVRPLRDHLDAGRRDGPTGGPTPDRRADAATPAGVYRAGDFRDALHEAADGREIRGDVGNARRRRAARLGWEGSVHQGHAQARR